MLYPRVTPNEGLLVADEQMVSCREHLLENHRILFLSGAITGETEPHNLLMALDTISHDPIRLVITSQGGDLDSAFLFYDTMRLIKAPIETLGRYCASAAAMLFAAGTKRYLLPHAKIMLHLPSGQMGGDSRDWDIQFSQMQGYKNEMINVLIECGISKSRQEILADIDREFWLEPAEAIAYGLADEIMSPEVWEKWINEQPRLLDN